MPDESDRRPGDAVRRPTPDDALRRPASEDSLRRPASEDGRRRQFLVYRGRLRRLDRAARRQRRRDSLRIVKQFLIVGSVVLALALVFLLMTGALRVIAPFLQIL